MRSFLNGLSIFYQKHNAILKAITTFLTLLGATNYVPLPWWKSPLLSWSISSQTTITIVIVLLSIIVYIYSRNRDLKSEIETLILRNTINKTSPEEHAELVKKQLIYAARFYAHLLSSNKTTEEPLAIKHEESKTET